MPEMILVDAIRLAMEEELVADERVFIVGEDVGKRGGVFRATVGLYEKFGSERVIDSPLAELSIVGVGIGAALYGMRPVCEIQFADFIYPAMNQIVSEAAKMCYRSNGDWTVPMVIRAPYGGGIGGLTIPINKAISQWNKNRNVQLDCLGHFHQFHDGGNFVVNSSLIGFSPYAISVKGAYERPTQTFFLINGRYLEKTCTTKIFLE